MKELIFTPINISYLVRYLTQFLGGIKQFLFFGYLKFNVKTYVGTCFLIISFWLLGLSAAKAIAECPITLKVNGIEYNGTNAFESAPNCDIHIEIIFTCCPIYEGALSYQLYNGGNTETIIIGPASHTYKSFHLTSPIPGTMDLELFLHSTTVNNECSSLIEFSIDIMPFEFDIEVVEAPEFVVSGCTDQYVGIFFEAYDDATYPVRLDVYRNDDYYNTLWIYEDNDYEIYFNAPSASNDFFRLKFIAYLPDASPAFCGFVQESVWIPVKPPSEVIVEKAYEVDETGTLTNVKVIFPEAWASPQEWIENLDMIPAADCCIDLNYGITQESAISYGIEYSNGFASEVLGFCDLNFDIGYSSGSSYTLTTSSTWSVQNTYNTCIEPSMNLLYTKLKVYNKFYNCDGTFYSTEASYQWEPIKIVKAAQPTGAPCPNLIPAPDCTNQGNINYEKANSTTRNNEEILAWFTSYLDGTCTYEFSNISCGEIDAWEWDFGDNTFSYEENPGSHEYDKPGTYTVTLTVTKFNNNGEDEVSSHPETIVIDNCDPTQVSGVIYGNGDAFSGETHEYEASAVGGVAPYTYEWDFGGAVIPNNATGTTQTVTFESNGNYFFRVTITDSFDEQTVETKHVSVGYGGENVVDFSHGPVVENFPISLLPEYNWWDMDGSETLTWFLGDYEWETGHFVSLPPLTAGNEHTVKLKVEYEGNPQFSEPQTIGIDAAPNPGDICVTMLGKSSQQEDWSFSNNKCSCDQNNANYESINVNSGQTINWSYGTVNTCCFDSNGCINGGNHALEDGFDCGNNAHKLSYRFINQNTLQQVTNKGDWSSPGSGFECKSNGNKTFDVVLDDWGCWDIEIIVGDNTGFFPASAYSCAVYVEPSILTIEDVSLNVDLGCDQFFLTSLASGGAAKEPNSISGTNTFCDDKESVYKSYSWECRDLFGNTIDILENEELRSCVQIDASSPYFDDQYYDRKFIVKLTIEDWLGNTESITKEINLGQKLNIRYPIDVYACPYTEVSVLGDGSGVAIEGGAEPYANVVFSRPGNGDINELFSSLEDDLPVTQELAPTYGHPHVFYVQVEDANGCTDELEMRLHIDELTAHAGGPELNVCGNSGYDSNITLGHYISTGRGGSGEYSYTYQWSPVYGLDDHRAEHPKVISGGTGSQTYTVTVTDQAGCTATDEVIVNYQPFSGYIHAQVGYPVNHNVICFGDKDYRVASEKGNYCIGCTEPTYTWTTDHPVGWSGNLGTVDPLLSQAMTEVPGEYEFILTTTDETTQCSDTDAATFTIKHPIKYIGYNSQPIWWEYALLGMPLWGDGTAENRIILEDEMPSIKSGASPPLQYSWNDNGYEISQLQFTNGVPSNGLFEGESLDPNLGLNIKDAHGCEVYISTNKKLNSVLPGGKITVVPEAEGAGGSYCNGDEICFDIILETGFDGNFLSYLPQSIDADLEFNTIRRFSLDPYEEPDIESQPFQLVLTDQIRGIYSGKFCKTAEVIGDHVNGTIRVLMTVGVDLNNDGAKLIAETIEYDILPLDYSLFAASPIKEIHGTTEGDFPACFANWIFAAAEDDIDACITGNDPNFTMGSNDKLDLYGGHEGGIYLGSYSTNVIVPENNHFHAKLGACLSLSPRPSNEINDITSEQVDSDFGNILSVNNLSSIGVGMKIIPNPFTDAIVLQYNAPKSAKTSLVIFDFFGKPVKRIFENKSISSGTIEEYLDLSDLPGGAYIFQLKIDGVPYQKKGIHIK